MNPTMQTTIGKDIQYTGIGLHSGNHNTIIISWAPPNTGIVFRCIERGEDVLATWDNIIDTNLNTKIGMGRVEFSLIEHLMSALSGLEIDNVIITLCGGEVPIADGSSLEWIELFDLAGIVTQDVPRKYIRVIKHVNVNMDDEVVDGTIIHNDRYASLSPSWDRAFNITTNFDGVGHQRLNVILNEKYYRENTAFCRTFGYEDDVDHLNAAGLAKGAGLHNAVVLKRCGAVVNQTGLRAHDEIIQHKLLDAIGDLYCAGYQILGKYESHKPGHNLNWMLLRELFADDSNWEFV